MLLMPSTAASPTVAQGQELRVPGGHILIEAAKQHTDTREELEPAPQPEIARAEKRAAVAADEDWVVL